MNDNEYNSERILEALKRLESMLQSLPEVFSATFLQMQEEYRKSDPFKTKGVEPKDLWDIANADNIRNAISKGVEDAVSTPSSEPKTGGI